MKNFILSKLGLSILTVDEATEVLYETHNGIAEMLIKDKVVDKELFEEQKTEVLLFLWIYAGVPFIFNCKNEVLKKILEDNIYRILFGRLTNEYDNEVFDDIYKSRREIYNSFFKVKEGLEMQTYLKITYKLLFKTPFEETTKEEELDSLGIFDYSEGMKEAMHISGIIKFIIPEYIKTLKKLSKNIRQ